MLKVTISADSAPAVPFASLPNGSVFCNPLPRWDGRNNTTFYLKASDAYGPTINAYRLATGGEVSAATAYFGPTQLVLPVEAELIIRWKVKDAHPL